MHLLEWKVTDEDDNRKTRFANLLDTLMHKTKIWNDISMFKLGFDSHFIQLPWLYFKDLYVMFEFRNIYFLWHMLISIKRRKNGQIVPLHFSFRNMFSAFVQWCVLIWHHQKPVIGNSSMVQALFGAGEKNPRRDLFDIYRDWKLKSKQ